VEGRAHNVPRGAFGQGHSWTTGTGPRRRSGAVRREITLVPKLLCRSISCCWSAIGQTGSTPTHQRHQPATRTTPPPWDLAWLPAMQLAEIAGAFARGIELADAKQPVALNRRTGAPYHPGIGPHSESDTTRLALGAITGMAPFKYSLEKYYPVPRREKCDLFLTAPEKWAIEIKLLRLLGDNGKRNDNMLMHILSPYPIHHSALTDFDKLTRSGFDARHAIMVFGYDYEDLQMDPAVEALEILARERVEILSHAVAQFDGLVHPVHRLGRVFAWEIAAQVPPEKPIGVVLERTFPDVHGPNRCC
jgi:hypothetical protein